MERQLVEKSIAGGYRESLKNKVYKLLPIREEGGEWYKYLDTVLRELYGHYDALESINFLSLIYKLNFLRFASYRHYRKTILECMDIIDELDVKI